ncbi:HAAS signaling domain-containing protein [Actinoplanes friuliensis]|jgi:hypothetical protein|uniref:Uncharacterized protein n=1 Tax=Actinoplanes friuliensis DSM 7358 TaxID=1246995 RepID=U5VPH5_9ACTN|nr:hypothetical protein [Actinoplanes friuliensis]AGZ38704.1 hypothetical protein AFR_02075 [Actinoplanes friuliensis DSM 7358]
MSINKTDDAVAEYLHELELRLSGLPVLQRRELLADLEAHITSERIERAVVSEGEVLDILERLGSPEVVAAAAYEEAGLLQPAGASAAPARAGARVLPAVPPPPDAEPIAGPKPPPPFAGAGASSAPLFDGPPFAGPPFSAPLPPYTGAPEGKSGTTTGMRVAVVLAAVTAAFLLLGCLGGAFLLANSTPGEAPSAVTVEAPAPPDEAPLPPRPDGN